MLQAIVTVAPAVYPVTTQELATQCKLGPLEGGTLMEDLKNDLDGAIAAATGHMEGFLGRALITQTRKAFAHCVSRCYLLPGVPLQSLESFTINTVDGTALIQSVSGFLVDTVEGRIVAKNATIFPAVFPRELNPVEIVYKCGYGDAGASVPAPIRKCLLMLGATLYRSREHEYEAVQQPRVMEAFNDMLREYRKL